MLKIAVVQCIMMHYDAKTTLPNLRAGQSLFWAETLLHISSRLVSSRQVQGTGLNFLHTHSSLPHANSGLYWNETVLPLCQPTWPPRSLEEGFSAQRLHQSCAPACNGSYRSNNRLQEDQEMALSIHKIHINHKIQAVPEISRKYRGQSKTTTKLQL